MSTLAIIGGSGLTQIPDLTIRDEIAMKTPWGQPSANLITGTLEDSEIVFLARHGNPHRIPPHKINYRANIWALQQIGAHEIIAVNAVGGITDKMTPCRIVLPDQLIDYTYDRDSTFYDGSLDKMVHIDFTVPYSAILRNELLMAAASEKNIDICTIATYGITQGPRLETAAEIKRLQRDGCDIVGMTGMPEASLARELGMEYSCCALVVNQAAGKTAEMITMEMIENNSKKGMEKLIHLLSALLHRRK